MAPSSTPAVTVANPWRSRCVLALAAFALHHMHSLLFRALPRNMGSGHLHAGQLHYVMFLQICRGCIRVQRREWVQAQGWRLVSLAIGMHQHKIAWCASLCHVQVGVGQVIKGWDVGILGSEADGIPPMKEGGKRTLVGG